MKKEEIQVVIKPDGQVEMKLEGFGKACEEYMKVFQQLLQANVKDKKLSSEYYSSTTTATNQQLKRS